MLQNKIDLELESKTFKESSEPVNKQKEEVIIGLVEDLASLISEFRSKLPPRSDRYYNALTSIIVVLNSYKSYSKNHIGIWNGYDYLSMSYTQYSYLTYCTESKNPKRESKIMVSLNQFLKELYPIWDIILSQHLDYKSKH